MRDWRQSVRRLFPSLDDGRYSGFDCINLNLNFMLHFTSLPNISLFKTFAEQLEAGWGVWLVHIVPSWHQLVQVSSEKLCLSRRQLMAVDYLLLLHL